MANNISVSINEVAVNNIILDIDNYQRNIKQILNSMADVYRELSKNTNYNGVQSYLSKANSITENAKIININLENYKIDLNKVKNSYKKLNVDVADNLNRAARNKNVGIQYRTK